MGSTLTQCVAPAAAQIQAWADDPTLTALFCYSLPSLEDGPMTQSGGGESRPSEAAVLERLRSLVENRVLPLTRPTRVWAGPCREEHACIACRTIIRVGDTEFDIVLASAQKVFFHPRCLNLWPDAGLDGVAAAG